MFFSFLPTHLLCLDLYFLYLLHFVLTVHILLVVCVPDTTCRLPGRSTLVRELREAFDCGQQPEFDMCEMDIHSIASLLKSYLRELPEPIIPTQFYDAVRKVVMRDIHHSPEKAYDRMYRLLTNIPQHNYNLLQYLCKFLQEVASNSETNKMTPMNLATVFAQSVIRPEDEDPAILMGTAQARTQIVFVLISQCDQIFKLEYTAQGGSVLVDNLVSFGEEEATGEDFPPVTSMNHSSSFQNDLLGLDWTGQCSIENDIDGPEDNTALEGQAGRRTSQPPDLVLDTAGAKDNPVARDSEIDPCYSYAQEQPSLDYNPSSDQVSQSQSEPIYDKAAEVDQNVVCNDSGDSSPSEGQMDYAQVNLTRKRRQRSIKNRSVQVYSEAQTLPLPPDDEEPVPPPPPPRPAQRGILESMSSVESLDLLNAQEASAEDNQAFEALVSMDLSGFGVDDLRTHIQTLCSELRSQRSKVTELISQQRELKRRHTDKVHKLAQKMNQEKTATVEAVDRIMKLQGQLQQYQMKYGPLE